MNGPLTCYQDLHLGNILVQFPNTIDGLSVPALYEKFGQPEPEAVVRTDGQNLSNSVPSHVFIPGWFGVSCDRIVLGKDKIVLSDFGESFNPDKELRYYSNTLPLIRPPETRFSDEPLSFASDIWTLACTIWEIFGQRPLFDAFFPTMDRVTMEQVEALGILPPQWWKKWEKRLEWFTEEGEPAFEGSRRHDSVHMPWNMRFDYCIQKPRAEAGLDPVTESERKAFEAMLRSMLRYLPKERATAEQLLQSEWMKDWGLPALDESWRSTGAGKHQERA